MKCINCGTDNSYGTQIRCKNCGTPFAFDPIVLQWSNLYRFTDTTFQRILDKLSSNDTLFFTKGQLFCTFNNSLSSKNSIDDFYIFFMCLSAFFFVFPLAFKFWVIVPQPQIAHIILLIFSVFWLIKLCFISNNFKRVHKKTRLESSSLMKPVGILSLIYASLNFFLQDWIWGSIFFTIGTIAIVYSQWQSTRIPRTPEITLYSPEFFDSLLSQWITAHGVPSKLLKSPSDSNELVPSPPSDDVTNYSFDRLVICQSDDIAQMLIANNVHFEFNCGIVSISSYPQNIFETVMAMAKRNPNLKVFVLHDCSPKGVSTLYTVKNSSQWFAFQDALIVDVGISPRQILSAKRSPFYLNSDSLKSEAMRLESAIRSSYTAKELKWLDSGNYVLLEFYRPQKIIETLSRSFYLGEQLDSIEDDQSSLIVLGSSDFYGVESFG